MPETTAQVGFGVLLQRQSANSPADYETVGEIIELGGPNMSRDAVEATHSQSPNRWREFIGGLRDGGEVTFTIALVPNATVTSAHAKLMADLNNDDRVGYRILFPDAVHKFTFDGLLTSLDHATPLDDRMTLAGAVKISGEPILAGA